MRDAASPGRGKQRRALTQARAPARIDTWGDAREAEALARALDVAGADEDHLRRFTHGFHSWPARMHPLTARRAIALLGLAPGATLCDPFCGSGTVLVEAALAGLRGVGRDLNPLAVLVSRARLWPASPAKRRELVPAARRIAQLVAEEGKAARRAGYKPPMRHLPPIVDVEAREAALRGWFDPHVRAELELIAAAIAGERDDGLRDVLRAVLSSILVKMSRRASDTVGETVTRRLGRGMAARLFAERAGELAEGLEALTDRVPAKTPPADLREGDARALTRGGVAAGSVAGIVSSPPYPGTYDYVHHHQLRLVFLGLGVSSLESNEMGARRRFVGSPVAVKAGIERFDRDMAQVMREMATALAPGGRAVLLAGDSLAGARDAITAVYADKWLPRLARGEGFVLVAAASQPRTMLGSWEKRAFSAAPKREHLMLFVKHG